MRSATTRSISGRQSMFRHFPGRFPVVTVFCHFPGQKPIIRMSSAMSRVDFRLAECVLPHPGSISERQSVFHHVPVDFRSAECVLLRPGLIPGRQSVFHHDPSQFPVGRVCSASSRECIPPSPGQFPVSRVCSAMSQVDFQLAEYLRSIRIKYIKLRAH